MPVGLERTNSALEVNSPHCEGTVVFLPSATTSNSYEDLKTHLSTYRYYEYKVTNGYTSIEEIATLIRSQIKELLANSPPNKPIKIVGHSAAIAIMLEVMQGLEALERDRVTWVMIEPAAFNVINYKVNSQNKKPYAVLIEYFKEMLEVMHSSGEGYFKDYQYNDTLELSGNGVAKTKFEVTIANYAKLIGEENDIFTTIKFLQAVFDNHQADAAQAFELFCNCTSTDLAEAKRFADYFTSFFSSIAAYHSWCTKLAGVNNRAQKQAIDKLVPQIFFMATRPSFKFYGPKMLWGSGGTIVMSNAELKSGNRFTCLREAASEIKTLMAQIKPIQFQQPAQQTEGLHEFLSTISDLSESQLLQVRFLVDQLQTAQSTSDDNLPTPLSSTVMLTALDSYEGQCYANSKRTDFSEPIAIQSHSSKSDLLISMIQFIEATRQGSSPPKIFTLPGKTPSSTVVPTTQLGSNSTF